MEAGARAEQAFERAWLKSPEDAEIFEKLEKAVAMQARLKALDPDDSFGSVRRYQKLIDRLETTKGDFLHKRVQALAGEASRLTEQGQTDRAFALWQEALALQETFNFHYPQSRHARWRLVQEIKDHLQRLEAARLNDRIERLLNAEEAGGSVEALEQAFKLQEKINQQYPTSEFYRPERLRDLGKRLSFDQSSTLAASISQKMENLNERLRDGEWETVGRLLGSLDQSVRSFLESFPSSLLPDETLPHRIEWLSQREAEIPALVEEVEKRLVRHPRMPDLRMLVSEVDQALYSRIMGTNPSRWTGDELPVDSVSYDQATVFCRRLGWMLARTVQLPQLHWLTIPELQPNRKEGLWLSPASGNRSQAVESSKLVGGLFDLYGNLEEWILHPDHKEKAWLFGGSGADTFHAVNRLPARWTAPHFRSRWTGFRFCVLAPDP